MTDITVEKLRFPYSQKVLPLVYDDSLSYYENICQFIQKLNEMAEVINTIKVDILEEAKAYTDSEIAKRISEIEELVRVTTENFERLLAEVDNKYNNFETYVNNQLVVFNHTLSEIREEIAADIIGVNARTDLAIKQNNEYILEEVAKGLVTMKVLNYFTGEYVTVQEMFDYLAQFHLQSAISYTQLIASEKTYDELQAYDEDYTSWAINGYNIINA